MPTGDFKTCNCNGNRPCTGGHFPGVTYYGNANLEVSTPEVDALKEEVANLKRRIEALEHSKY